MINGDLSARLADARGRLINELSSAVTDWGGQVPEDPGVAELAVLLEDVAARLHTITSSTRAELAGAVSHLRAADRLGGLLPAVTLWHLGQALQQAATLPGIQEPTATGEPAPDLLSRQQRLQLPDQAYPSGCGQAER
ncbi:hypothetical protein [Streptomyces sp. 196(2019)]|uniref:hypothetical protein n=1 Tax=Streptomyces sp. 196(2019) TaxID=2683820 RepID=UPI0019D2DE86|nr:hypothetical protein [Streptomyces sp. 196(2019)]